MIIDFVSAAFMASVRTARIFMVCNLRLQRGQIVEVTLGRIWEKYLCNKELSKVRLMLGFVQPRYLSLINWHYFCIFSVLSNWSKDFAAWHFKMP